MNYLSTGDNLLRGKRAVAKIAFLEDLHARGKSVWRIHTACRRDGAFSEVPSAREAGCRKHGIILNYREGPSNPRANGEASRSDPATIVQPRRSQSMTHLRVTEQ